MEEYDCFDYFLQFSSNTNKVIKYLNNGFLLVTNTPESNCYKPLNGCNDDIFQNSFTGDYEMISNTSLNLYTSFFIPQEGFIDKEFLFTLENNRLTSETKYSLPLLYNDTLDCFELKEVIFKYIFEKVN